MILLNPLTTKDESYSDLPEIFTTDSSNFLKNKMFLHEFFSSRGYQDIRNFRFFLFLTVWTYFSSDLYQNFWDDRPQNVELESSRYLQPFRKYNEKRFRFFNSAPLQCTAFLPKKRLFGTNSDLKWVVSVIKWFCFLLRTAETKGSTV